MLLVDHYRAVRSRTLALAEPLSAEDQMVQSMPDTSPTKWHLAHTSWFFETFVLAGAGLAPFDPHYRVLYNSYYETVGAQAERVRRGTVSRPDLATVLAYRRQVDEEVVGLLETGRADESMRSIVELGIHHEQQHQELVLTDIKHAFATNPLQPVFRTAREPDAAPAEIERETALRFRTYDEGLTFVGYPGPGFAFDNEGPRHRKYLRAFGLGDRLVTCGEYLDFMRDGGYARAELWLSDGWHVLGREQWRAPLYWEEIDGVWTTYTLGGRRPVDPREALAHVSYYEADAFARWAGARLPTEEEWERAAAEEPVELTAGGHFAEANVFQPGLPRTSLFGDVWQWTQSPYAAYPGYRPPPGALGEYNGKFMCNQMVLRGGSCLTPADHVRATYRNFFPPGARWQASGIRLARDA